MRNPDNVEHHCSVTEHTASGVTQHRRPVTEDEQRGIEDDQNSYLHDVGLPANRPYGYRWFQVVPEDRAVGDILAAAHEAIDASAIRRRRLRTIQPAPGRASGRTR